MFKHNIMFWIAELDDFPCNQVFNKKIYDKRYKNETDVYEKIKVGYEPKEAGMFDKL